MADSDDLPKHLEFITEVVERLARNSFLLKGWSITLVAACFLLAARGTDSSLALVVALLPCLAFWGLDAYYLRQNECIADSIAAFAREERPTIRLH